jgi:hypothetical protein
VPFFKNKKFFEKHSRSLHNSCAVVVNAWLIGMASGPSITPKAKNIVDWKSGLPKCPLRG